METYSWAGGLQGRAEHLFIVGPFSDTYLHGIQSYLWLPYSCKMLQGAATKSSMQHRCAPQPAAKEAAQLGEAPWRAWKTTAVVGRQGEHKWKMNQGLNTANMHHKWHQFLVGWDFSGTDSQQRAAVICKGWKREYKEKSRTPQQ